MKSVTIYNCHKFDIEDSEVILQKNPTNTAVSNTNINSKRQIK